MPLLLIKQVVQFQEDIGFDKQRVGRLPRSCNRYKCL
jgi:hypothetical protein